MPHAARAHANLGGVAAPRHTDRGEATRLRIVEAAVVEIEESGVDGMSLDRVLGTARASKGQLYHYFDSRAELVRAAVATRADEVLELQAGMMHRLDDWNTIQAWFDCLVQLQVDGDARGGCPLASLAGALAERDEVARRVLESAFDRWEQVLASGLRAMVARGELSRDANPDALATATMASVQGGLVLCQVRRDPAQLRVALDAALAHLRANA